MARRIEYRRISIHAPREGGDGRTIMTDAKIARFQSTPPARGATKQDAHGQQKDRLFQSTPPARGATLFKKLGGGTIAISIHAPREGGDDADHEQPRLHQNISIHAPREGGDAALDTIGFDNPMISIHAPREGGDV